MQEFSIVPKSPNIPKNSKTIAEEFDPRIVLFFDPSDDRSLPNVSNDDFDASEDQRRRVFRRQFERVRGGGRRDVGSMYSVRNAKSECLSCWTSISSTFPFFSSRKFDFSHRLRACHQKTRTTSARNGERGSNSHR